MATVSTPERAGERPHSTRPLDRVARWAPATVAIPLGAALLWLLCGVGFVNYDTLYALVWGAQLTRGQTPQYGLPIAPTPHPLAEALGVVLAPFGPSTEAAIAVALAFGALAACGWVMYRLGSEWFGRAAGAVAALVLLTRVPVLSYGVRAYVDVPYLLLVLSALLVETRRPRAGAPVLALLGLAGLLRPEAWAFSGVYWIYLAVPTLRAARADARAGGGAGEEPGSAPPTAGEHAAPGGPPAPRTRAQLGRLALLAAAAPAVWIASDLLITGNAMWSLSNTKHTAEVLGRETGIAKVPEYVPRRIGAVLRPTVLAAAALGGVLSVAWLWRRARLGAAAGVLAVAVFAAMACAGLPIDERYAFGAAAILALFAGAGVFGWTRLPRGDRRRVPWMAVGAAALVAMVASLPGQVRAVHRQLDSLARQESIQDDLLALVHSGAISLRCGPVGVPNHAPIPLLALYLKARPSLIVSAEAKPIARGVYVDPASVEVERDYILDPKDPHTAVSIPPGFRETTANRSWLIFSRCE